MPADVPLSRCFQKPNVFSRTRLAFPAETDFPLACLRIRIREQKFIFHARKLSETPEIQFQGLFIYFFCRLVRCILIVLTLLKKLYWAVIWT